MPRLYEIEQAILDCIDMETGEIIDLEKLNDLQMEREAKIDGILCWIKDLNAEAAAIREEEKALAERRHRAEKKAKDLTWFISQKLDGKKFETARNSVSWRRSSAVVFTDEAQALSWCMEHADNAIKYKAPELDKVALRDLLKAGVKVDGTVLEERTSIQIK